MYLPELEMDFTVPLKDVSVPEKKQAMFEPVEGPKPKREVDDARKIIVSQAKEMEKEGAFNLADMMGGGEMIE